MPCNFKCLYVTKRRRYSRSILPIVFSLCFLIMCILLNLQIRLFSVEQYYAQATHQGKRETNTEIKYIHEPYSVCNGLVQHQPHSLLILVKSDIYNIAQRLAIRATWGYINIPEIRVIFTLGTSADIQGFIIKETQLYDDILQGDFPDTYANNIYKTVMTYQWIVDNCVNTSFYFFVDDDFFVNVNLIHQYLKEYSSQVNPYLYTGKLITYSWPVRKRNSKWFISVEDYPYNYYPPYLAGGSIIMSANVAKLLKETFPYVKYIFIDDSYLGIVAYACHLVPSNDDRMSIDYKVVEPEQLKSLFSSHGYGNHRQLRRVWDNWLKHINLNWDTDNVN